jgi:hypothetical protein
MNTSNALHEIARSCSSKEKLMVKKISRFHRSSFIREKIPSPAAVSISVSIYFFGALAIYAFDHLFLLSAWLAGGPLLYTVYLTRDARESLLNPYTLFFAGLVVLNLCGYAVSLRS